MVVEIIAQLNHIFLNDISEFLKKEDGKTIRSRCFVRRKIHRGHFNLLNRKGSLKILEIDNGFPREQCAPIKYQPIIPLRSELATKKGREGLPDVLVTH